MSFTTADLCDQHEAAIQVVTPMLNNYGGIRVFGGQIATLEVFEDNLLVREALSEPGNGKVLVIDGGGSLRTALVGDNLAAMAHTNGWAGIVVYGCIRDWKQMVKIPIGMKALNTNPRRSAKGGAGARNVLVTFAGVSFRPGTYLYADEDGIVVAEYKLI